MVYIGFESVAFGGSLQGEKIYKETNEMKTLNKLSDDIHENAKNR